MKSESTILRRALPLVAASALAVGFAACGPADAAPEGDLSGPRSDESTPVGEVATVSQRDIVADLKADPVYQDVSKIVGAMNDVDSALGKVASTLGQPQKIIQTLETIGTLLGLSTGGGSDSKIEDAGLPLRPGERLLRLQGIVDQDDVGTAYQVEHTTGGGSEPITLAGGGEFLDRPAMRRQTGQEDPPIPRAHHDAATIAGELVGEILGIADAQDPGRGIVPQTPGRERD